MRSKRSLGRSVRLAKTGRVEVVLPGQLHHAAVPDCLRSAHIRSNALAAGAPQ